MSERRYRRDVSVDVFYSQTGQKKPLRIYWEDEGIIKKLLIDSVMECVPRASLLVGGAGLRYQVRIGSTTTYLFFDEQTETWFVEAKQPYVDNNYDDQAAGHQI